MATVIRHDFSLSPAVTMALSAHGVGEATGAARLETSPSRAHGRCASETAAALAAVHVAAVAIPAQEEDLATQAADDEA